MEEVEVIVQKAQGLVDLNRYPAAIKELKKALSIDPDHFYGLALICGCFIDEKDKEEALEYSQKLLSVYPYEALSHYYMAHAHDLNGETEKAESEIREAIEIEPNDADYMGFLAAIYIDKRDWEQALKYVNQGLEIDPESVLCLNHRTLILTKLGRKEEMRTAAEDTLAASPDHWYSHANVGWSLLETREYNKAKGHFLEALRINPNAEHARDGMKEALKAQNFLFRWYLNYAFWMVSKSDKVQWGVIIAFVFARRIFTGLASEYPIFYVVVALMILLVYSVWIMDTVGDLLLLTDRFGRHILRDGEKKAGWITGIGLSLALLSGIIGFALGLESWYYLSVVFATFIIPVGRYFHEKEENRTLLSKAFPLGISFLAMYTIYGIFFKQSVDSFWIYILSLAVYSIAFNFRKTS